MRRFRRGFAAAVLLAGTAAMALAGDVVILKGGTAIPLKGPWVRRGNTAYLTRPDGSVLSVAVSEIDRDATAAARAAAASPPPPPSQEAAPATPAEAARSNGDGPKARVRITDADVSHPLDFSNPAAGDEKGKKALPPGSARVEIVSYNQKKDGDSLVVTGQLRNPTQQLTENVRLNVIVLDGKGEVIDSAEASLSNGEIESGSTVDFTAKIKVGEKIATSLRFAPTWSGPKPPAPTPNPYKPGQRPAAAAPPSTR